MPKMEDYYDDDEPSSKRFQCQCDGEHLGACLGPSCPYADDEGPVLCEEERGRAEDGEDAEEV